MSAALQGRPTKKQIRRNERKGEKGVCRIQKRCGGRQGYKTVGSGLIIKNEDVDRSSKYFIVTTSKVFEDFDVTKYRVDFVKSGSKLKTFQLNGAVVGRQILHNSSGLAVIPLDSHSSVFRHGLFRKKCGILKHRPFRVELFDNNKTEQSAFLNELCCHAVADEIRSNLFGVKPHDLSRDSSSGEYVVSNLQSSFPLGAGILRRIDRKWSAVGVLSSNTAPFIPVWLSRENFSNFRTGEARIVTSEVDAVVYSVPTPSGTLQSIPVVDGNQNGGMENSTVLDQASNGPHDEQTSSSGTVVNNIQHSKENDQQRPNRAHGNTLNEGSVQAGISSETNNGQARRTTSENDTDVFYSAQSTFESVDTWLQISPLVDGNQATNGSHDVLYIGDIVNNATLMDELARCLDKEYRVLKYWKHLADKFQIPPDVQKGFEIYFELSPTVHLFQFLSTNDPRLTVGKLRIALKEIHRNDLIQELKDFSDTTLVVDAFDNKPSLLDGIALKLDSAKRPVGNWRSLAVKLISTGQLFKEFEAQLHSSENPTALLFRYLSTTENFSQLTVDNLKGHLKTLSRNDVLKVLAEYDIQDGALLTDVFSPDSDVLNTVSNLLNKKSPGIRNWRNLASKLGVPNKVYEEFDPDASSPKHHPTKMMLEWLRSEHPDMTADKFRSAVKEIGRNDALEILDGYLFNSQGTKNESSSGGGQSLENTPNTEQKQTTKVKRDEVDNGLVSPPVLDISPSKSSKETLLMTAVTELPYRVYGKICLKLNIRRLLFDDFRMLGEKVGLSRDEVEYLGQQENPTEHILKHWSKSGQATVKKLMDILAEEGLERSDVIEILQNWVDQ